LEERSLRPPLPPFTETSAIEKAVSCKTLGVGRDAIAGERRTEGAECDIRSFARKLVEQRNSLVVSNKPPRTVNCCHEQPSARSVR
jgi:hypothetical protein